MRYLLLTLIALAAPAVAQPDPVAAADSVVSERPARGVFPPGPLIAPAESTEATGPQYEELEYLMRIETLLARNRWPEAQRLAAEARKAYPTSEPVQSGLMLLTWLRLVQEIRWWLLGFVVLVVGGVGVMLWVALVRMREPARAAHYYNIGLYVLVIPLVLLGVLFQFSGAGAFGTIGLALTETGLILMACLLGTIGGALRNSIELAGWRRVTPASRGEGEEELAPTPERPPERTFAQYAFRPMNGFFLAAVMYAVVKSGQFLLFGDTSESPEPYAIAVLALLSGLFSDAALNRLWQVGENLFGEDSMRQEGIVAQQQSTWEYLVADEDGIAHFYSHLETRYQLTAPPIEEPPPEGSAAPSPEGSAMPPPPPARRPDYPPLEKGEEPASEERKDG